MLGSPCGTTGGRAMEKNTWANWWARTPGKAHVGQLAGEGDSRLDLYVFCFCPPVVRLPWTLPASCSPSLDLARQLSAFPGPCPPVVRLPWTLPASCPPSLDLARQLSAFPGPCPPVVGLPWTLPASCPPSLDAPTIKSDPYAFVPLCLCALPPTKQRLQSRSQHAVGISSSCM